MIRSVRKSATSLDDATSLAGWVFADLLLSLSIIFLTSISFAVPSTSNESSIESKGSGKISSSLQIDERFTASPLLEGFNFYYKDFNADRLQDDLSRYFQLEGLPLNTEVIYAQLAGGYLEGAEGSDKGTMAALKFSISLNKANLPAFQHTSIDLLTSNQIPPGVIALRLTFAPAIGK